MNTKCRFKVVSVLYLLLSFCVSLHGQTIIRSLDVPLDEPRGLTWDGGHLWCADSKADSIYQLDVEGNIASSFSFSMENDYGDLCFRNDWSMLVTDFRGGYSWILNVDPSNGTIYQDCSFHCPGG